MYGRRVGVFTSDIYQISFVKLNRLASQHKFVRAELADGWPNGFAIRLASCTISPKFHTYTVNL